jgi:hypothetical protein
MLFLVFLCVIFFIPQGVDLAGFGRHNQLHQCERDRVIDVSNIYIAGVGNNRGNFVGVEFLCLRVTSYCCDE